MAESRKVLLGDCVDVITGYPFSSSRFRQSGDVRLLRGDNIAQGYIRWGGAKYWPTDALAGVDQFQLRELDVVLAMDRPWIDAGLKYAVVHANDLPALLVQRVACLRARPGVDQRFVQYITGSSDFTNYVLSVQTGTAVPHISATQIREYSFLLPSLSAQRGIAEVLSVIDDKANCSLLCAKTEDALLGALYDIQSGEESEYARLGDIATLVLGGTPDRTKPEFWTGGSIPWINSGKANDFRVIEPSELITEQAVRESATKLMPRETTIVAITGATLGQVTRIEIAACGNQSLVGIRAEERAVNDWLYVSLRNRQADFAKHATGGAQQHINKGVVHDLQVSMPKPANLREWHARARPLLDHIAALLVERAELLRVRRELSAPLLDGRVVARAVQPMTTT